jgi:hypothetical protein
VLGLSFRLSFTPNGKEAVALGSANQSWEQGTLKVSAAKTSISDGQGKNMIN